MDRYYFPVFEDKRLPVAGMRNAPIIGAILDFTGYSLNHELPSKRFKVVSAPIKTLPMTYTYSGRELGWSNDYEVYEFLVEMVVP